MMTVLLLIALWVVCLVGSYGYAKAWRYRLWHQESGAMGDRLHKYYQEHIAQWQKREAMFTALVAPIAFMLNALYDSQWRHGMRFKD